MGREIPKSAAEALGNITGSLTAVGNETVSAVLQVDVNATVYGRVLFGGSGSQYSVLDGSGATLAIEDLESDAITPGGSSFDQFELNAPPSGSITLRLIAGPEGAELDYSFFFSNGRRLVVEWEPPEVTVGASTHIAAKVVDTEGNVLVGGSGSCTGTIALPDETSVPITLLDDGAHDDGAAGDGVFGAAFDGTMLEGAYEVAVLGAQDFGSYQVVRSGNARLLVVPTGAGFSGGMTDVGVDTDGNGLYDMLRIEQGISFTKNGRYRLLGELVDAQGQNIWIPRWEYENTQGVHLATAELDVPAAAIVRHGGDGPWTLTNIRLVSKDADWLRVATAPNYDVGGWDTERFERPIPPIIASVDPTSGSRAGGYLIIIKGTGLRDVEQVEINGKGAEFEEHDDETLAVRVPEMGGALPTGRKVTQILKGGAPVKVVAVDIRIRTHWGVDVGDQVFFYEM